MTGWLLTLTDPLSTTINFVHINGRSSSIVADTIITYKSVEVEE